MLSRVLFLCTIRVLLPGRGHEIHPCLTAIKFHTRTQIKDTVCLTNIKGAEPPLCSVRIYFAMKGEVKMCSLFLRFLPLLGILAFASGQEQLLMVFGGLPWWSNETVFLSKHRNRKRALSKSQNFS